MPVKTGRADQNATVHVDFDRCTSCGLCVKVCKGGPLHLDNGRLVVHAAHGVGCFACGHCAAICPQSCITIEGRDLAAGDIVPLPPKESLASYDQLYSLLLTRRSIREFLNREVPQETIDKILRAASTAPMGIPPSDVGVLIFQGFEKVQVFKKDMLVALQAMRKIFSGPMLTLWRPFIGQEACELFKTFLLPAIDGYLQKDQEGGDWFSYGAPLGMLFYGSAYSDPTDSVIAATYAMIAAESLGLGSCILGFPAPILKRNKKLAAKYKLPPKAQPGMMVIFGYPAVKFQRAIQRRFADMQRS